MITINFNLKKINCPRRTCPIAFLMFPQIDAHNNIKANRGFNNTIHLCPNDKDVLNENGLVLAKLLYLEINPFCQNLFIRLKWLKYYSQLVKFSNDVSFLLWGVVCRNMYKQCIHRYTSVGWHSDYLCRHDLRGQNISLLHLLQ
jgi:hypothetical protein